MSPKQTPEEEQHPEPGRFRAAVGRVMAHLSTQDLNPHEGRLRGSAMPVEYMHIPDHPPLHDDTIPAAPETPPEDTPEAK